MRRIPEASLIVLFAVGSFTFGQQATAPAVAVVSASVVAPAHMLAQTASAGSAPVADASGRYMLREGADVDLQFAQDLSSSMSFEGDPVMLTLVKDLKVGDVVVAKAGSKASGVVTRAQKSGMMGKSGQLDIRLDYLQTGDSKIKLRGTRGKEDGGGVKGALLAPIDRIKHGKNVEIKAGDPLHAYVANDILLPPVS